MPKVTASGIAAIAACTACAGVSAQELQGTDVLNFALNLECLEAEFYSWAAFGHGLSDERLAGGPPSVGGRKAQLSDSVQQLAEEIANDEIAHVDFFRAALGDLAVPCPAIDIGPAFAAAANAAAGAELDPAFDPYANDVFFLHGAFVFEDVGVTAFRGAVEPLIPLVEPSTLSAAAAVLAVEAYHAGAIRTLLRELSLAGEDSYTGAYGDSVMSDVMQTPYGPIVDVVALISDLRDSVDGDDDLDQGIVDAEGRTNIVPTDDNGLVFSRTVDQVLPIVYLGAEPGGFLPEGVNGFFGPM